MDSVFTVFTSSPTGKRQPVVNMHNNFVAALWQAVNAILEPLLRPIRRHMPDTGALDLSPMVLIIGLTILQIILKNLAYGAMA